MDIKIKYDGAYPALCFGTLSVIIVGKEWRFPDECLSSGGYVTVDGDGDAYVGEGIWSVSDWPKDFPDNIKEAVLAAINEHIPYGCCGGCV